MVFYYKKNQYGKIKITKVKNSEEHNAIYTRDNKIWSIITSKHIRSWSRRISRWKKYNLKEDDLIIINSKEIHSIKSEKSNIVIVVQVDLSSFNDIYEGIDKINFNCKSFEYSKDDKRFIIIRKILASINK